ASGPAITCEKSRTRIPSKSSAIDYSTVSCTSGTVGGDRTVPGRHDGSTGSWRRGRDSNPRQGVNPEHAFQACDFNHSSTSPGAAILANPLPGGTASPAGTSPDRVGRGRARPDAAWAHAMGHRSPRKARIADRLDEPGGLRRGRRRQETDDDDHREADG